MALEQYEPFMGTFLHLKLDTISIQGLYFDYLGPDMVALNDLGQRLSASQKMALRSPFDRVHVMFTGPWSTGCTCYSKLGSEPFVGLTATSDVLELSSRAADIQIT